MSKFNYSFFFLFSFFFLLTSTFAKAQLLWEISGNNIKQKSYLFGTVHVGDERVIEYASNVYPYMDNSTIVAGELDLNFMTSIMAIAYIMSPKDSTLSKLLSKEEYKEIKPYLVENIGELAPFVDMVRPVFVMSLLQEKEQEEYTKSENNTKENKGEKIEKIEKFPPLDMHLQNRARKNEQIVIGLETIEEQMNALNSTPIDKQVRELYDYIIRKIEIENKLKAKNETRNETRNNVEIEKTLQDSTKIELDTNANNQSDTISTELENEINPVEKLIALYLSEDIELLHDQVSSEFEKKMYEALIIKRNNTMVQRMEEKMKEKQTRENRKNKKNIIFAAVGAGHLGGENGMVNLLRQAGYILTPIFFNKN